MPRSIWNGALSFGLVNVPVQLFSAVEPKDVALPRVPSRHRRAHQAQARVGTYRPGGRLLRHREGLRDLAGQVRDAHAGGARVGRAREVAHDRHRGLRRARGDRSDLLRQAVLPRAAEGRGEVVRAAARSDGEERARRDRALRHAHQAVPRRDPRRRQRARARDAVLRRRDPRHERRSTSRSAPRCRTASCASRTSSSTA